MEILQQTYFIVLPIVVTAFMGWITAILKEQQKERDEQKKAQKANDRGVMLMLRYMLGRYHTEYIHKQYVTTEQYNAYEEMYQAYADLGGNGCATHMWQDIQKLEIRNDVHEGLSPYAELLFEFEEDRRKEKEEN